MEPLKFDREKAALLVLDCQNDIVHERGALASWGFAAQVQKRGMLQRLKAVIGVARKASVPVIYVTVAYRQGRSDVIGNCSFFGAVREMPVLEEGSWGVAVHDDLKPDPEEFVVIKKRISAFASTTLDLLLRSMRRSTLVLAGVATNFVVEATARDACDAAYEVVVLEDCCAAATEEMHRFSAEKILPLLAAVTTSGEWIEQIGSLDRQ